MQQERKIIINKKVLRTKLYIHNNIDDVLLTLAEKQIISVILYRIPRLFSASGMFLACPQILSGFQHRVLNKRFFGKTSVIVYTVG